MNKLKDLRKTCDYTTDYLKKHRCPNCLYNKDKIGVKDNECKRDKPKETLTPNPEETFTP